MVPIKPPRLRKGDLVGVITPSSPITENLFPQLACALTTLESYGLEIKFARNARAQLGYKAGTTEQRVADFEEIWFDPKVKMVLFAQGGCVANHLLPYLNFDRIRATPKIVSGISDGTTLLNPIYSKSNLMTFHGPDLLWAFGRPMTPAIHENMVKTFFGEEIGALQPNPLWRQQGPSTVAPRGWRCLRPGRASGRLIGGHLASLINITFAGYGPDFKGRILFLEGTETDLHYLDKALHALKLRGVFADLAALVIGWFDNIESNSPTAESVVGTLVQEVTSGYDLPILEIGELGHNVENYVMPIGCLATVDSAQLRFSIDEIPVT